MSSIGIVDWGIGGLGVVRELRAVYIQKHRQLPAISYFSDTGAPPYGTLSSRELTARLRVVISFLRERGASKVILACNAASTALPALEDSDVSGVIAPTIDAVAKFRKKFRSVLVIGGRRTIRSRVYAKALRAHGFDVAQRIAQPLSGMIERGEQHTAQLGTVVRNILRGKTHYNALLLACTHYPAVFEIFEKQFPGAVIDPLPAIAQSLRLDGDPKSSQKLDEFFTTGDAGAMKASATRAWGDAFSKLEPKRVRL